LRILKRDSTVAGLSGKVDLLKKDLGYVVEAARSTGALLPGVALVEQLYAKTGTEEIPERGAVGLMLALLRSEQTNLCV